MKTDKTVLCMFVVNNGGFGEYKFLKFCHLITVNSEQQTNITDGGSLKRRICGVQITFYVKQPEHY